MKLAKYGAKVSKWAKARPLVAILVVAVMVGGLAYALSKLPPVGAELGIVARTYNTVRDAASSAVDSTQSAVSSALGWTAGGLASAGWTTLASYAGAAAAWVVSE